MRKSLIPILILIGLLAPLLPGGVRGGVPGLINYQGKLTDTLGGPLNLEAEMTFAIYTQSTGGGVVWSETQTVTITDGLFNVLLGSVNPLAPDYFSAYPRAFLGVKAGTDPEMVPRQEIASVAYALKTAGITVKDGNIGIGTKDPGTRLEVGGDIKTSGNVIIPNVPAFRAYKSGGGTTFAAGDHIFDSVEFNNGNHYNSVTGRFTAPVAGIYFFKVHFFLYTSYNNTTNNYISISKNGSSVRTTNIGHQEYDGGLEISAVLQLSAGEYVNTRANYSIATYGGQYNSFSGFLVSGL